MVRIIYNKIMDKIYKDKLFIFLLSLSIIIYYSVS